MTLRKRAALEAEFLHLCHLHGPRWIESILRPLGLSGVLITAQDIPPVALFAAVRVFGKVKRRVPR